MTSANTKAKKVADKAAAEAAREKLVELQRQFISDVQCDSEKRVLVTAVANAMAHDIRLAHHILIDTFKQDRAEFAECYPQAYDKPIRTLMARNTHTSDIVAADVLDVFADADGVPATLSAGLTKATKAGLTIAKTLDLDLLTNKLYCRQQHQTIALAALVSDSVGGKKGDAIRELAPKALKALGEDKVTLANFRRVYDAMLNLSQGKAADTKRGKGRTKKAEKLSAAKIHAELFRDSATTANVAKLCSPEQVAELISQLMQNQPAEIADAIKAAIKAA